MQTDGTDTGFRQCHKMAAKDSKEKHCRDHSVLDKRR